MRVGFLGTGEIAAAMVEGLSGRGHDLIVSARSAGVAVSLASKFSDVQVAENAEVVEGSGVVFLCLCLLADVARDVLSVLPWRGDQAFISVMVDVPLADLAMLCAPASDIALTIPLSSIATGRSVLPCHPDRPTLRALFAQSDTIIAVTTEAGLNAHFAASALSAPLPGLMQTGAQWLGAQTGDAAGAETYVAGVFAGFLRQMSSQGTDFDNLLQGLATEGGLNATLREHVARAGAPEALANGLDGLKTRLKL